MLNLRRTQLYNEVLSFHHPTHLYKRGLMINRDSRPTQVPLRKGDLVWIANVSISLEEI